MKQELLPFTIIVSFLVLASISLSNCVSVSNLQGIIKQQKTTQLDEKTIIAGLKEALSIGTKNAVSIVSRANGYLSNPKIYIPLPDELSEVASRLRQIGLGKDVDRFIEDMNHSAEKAATGAVDIFVDAVKKMTLTDAINILRGPDNAATKYFEDNTRAKLYGAFFPVIKDAMARIGVTKLYKFLIDAYNKIPFVQKKTYDLDRYITNKALDGLFYMVAGEEKKIRKDPAARVTELLRKVFG
jgi:hypothetical protein